MTPEYLTATSRAARLVAGTDADDTIRPLREAQADGHVEALVLALAVRCRQLAAELYGDHAQNALDEFAFDALNYEKRQRAAG